MFESSDPTIAEFRSVNAVEIDDGYICRESPVGCLKAACRSLQRDRDNSVAAQNRCVELWFRDSRAVLWGWFSGATTHQNDSSAVCCKWSAQRLHVRMDSITGMGRSTIQSGEGNNLVRVVSLRCYRLFADPGVGRRGRSRQSIHARGGDQRTTGREQNQERQRVGVVCDRDIVCCRYCCQMGQLVDGWIKQGKGSRQGKVYTGVLCSCRIGESVLGWAGLGRRKPYQKCRGLGGITVAATERDSAGHLKQTEGVGRRGTCRQVTVTSNGLSSWWVLGRMAACQACGAIFLLLR